MEQECREMTVTFHGISVQFNPSVFATPWTAACQASLSMTNSQSLLKLCPSSQWCHPTSSFSVGLLLPSVFPSVRVFPGEWVRIRWHWNFSFSFIISPSNEYSGLISFRIDWIDLVAVQGTLKSVLQHQSLKISVLPMNIQDWFPLGLTGMISLQSKGLLRVFSNTTVQKHQFFGAQLSSQSNSHTHTWPQEKP